jgi:hypothetical protein
MTRDEYAASSTELIRWLQKLLVETAKEIAQNLAAID